MTQADPQIQRLDAGGAAPLLERLSGTGLVERGLVNLISVNAIRDRAGERWPRRREDVWAYVNRKLAERLSRQDSHHRVNETDFLIAMPDESPAGAQGVALGVLEEVLEFFLGAADPLDLDIRTVTSLSKREIACARIDPGSIAVERHKAPSIRTVSDIVTHRRIDPREEARRNPFWFTATGGVGLRVDFATETVVSLKLDAQAALRIAPTITQAADGRPVTIRTLIKMSDEDLATISRAVLDYASLFAPEAGGKTPPIIAPGMFRTLATTKGRALLVGTPETHGWMRSGLMLELVDLDRGVPESRLIEVVGLLGALSRGVFARLRPGKDVAAPIRGVRLQGVCLDATDLSGDASRDAALMLDFAGKLRGQSPVLLAQGLPAAGFFDIAQVAGFTHASLRAEPVTRRSAA